MEPRDERGGAGAWRGRGREGAGAGEEEREGQPVHRVGGEVRVPGCPGAEESTRYQYAAHMVGRVGPRQSPETPDANGIRQMSADRGRWAYRS